MTFVSYLRLNIYLLLLTMSKLNKMIPLLWIGSVKINRSYNSSFTYNAFPLINIEVHCLVKPVLTFFKLTCPCVYSKKSWYFNSRVRRIRNPILAEWIKSPPILFKSIFQCWLTHNIEYVQSKRQSILILQFVYPRSNFSFLKLELKSVHYHVTICLYTSSNN